MALTTLSSLTPPTELSRGVCESLYVLLTETNLRGAAMLCYGSRAWDIEVSHFFFFSLAFFPLLPSWLLRIEVLPISSFLKRCGDSLGIQFTVVKACMKELAVPNKQNTELDNNSTNDTKKCTVEIDWKCLDQR